MTFDSFMRLIVMFDLPMISNNEKRIYRKFIKFLTNDGYIRIQFSIYSKLCINNDSANTAARRLKSESPLDGDIRYMIVTERQYQNIVNINNTYSLQENLITTDRILIVGGMNDENCNR